MSWIELGKVDPEDLADARGQLHWAMQVVAAAGETYLEQVDDTSHQASVWLAQQEALAGGVHQGARPFRVALRPRDLNLMLLDDVGNVVDDHPLDGRSYAGAQRWVRKAARAITAGALDSELADPGLAIPPHPVGSGARFDRSHAAAFEELSGWYANAALLLEELASDLPGASEVRCWPHHFDMAILQTLQTDAQGVATQTLGIGLSPGDASYGVPYFYVNVWPAPAAPALPALEAGGEWHSDGWLGAVLTAPRLLAADSAAGQAEQTRRFLAVALQRAEDQR